MTNLQSLVSLLEYTLSKFKYTLILLSIPIQSPFHHCPHNHYSPSLSCSLFQFYDITMMSYVAYYSLIVLSAVAVLTLLPVNIGVAAGPLDSFSWARADKIPIDVNLPWLPCKYHLPLHLFSTRKPTQNMQSSCLFYITTVTFSIVGH